MSGQLEQRRRDFMRMEPDLYDYIVARLTARVLDDAGNTASGVSHDAANRLWAMAAQANRRYEQLADGDER